MSALSPSQAILRFGDFQVDLRSCELRKHGNRIKLQVQPFQVLQILLQHAGEVVSREELQKRIWPADTYVDFDQGLNNAVKKLRGALGDDAEKPRFIETLSKRGYRFIAPVNGSNLKKPVVNAGRWKIAATVVIGVAVVAAGVWFWPSRHGSMLTEKDTIVLGDFVNSTGDPVFDGALREGLSAQLQQSPFLSLLSDEGIHQTLRMMGQTTNVRLSPEITQEVCQRTNSTAALDGSIVLIGTRYNLILKAVSCSNGDLLASTEAQASDKSHVLDALSKVASEMRPKLGESLTTIQKYNRPLEQATTSSLEALKAYSLGLKAAATKGDFDAIPFLKRAIELDPNFAAAYSDLVWRYENLGEWNIASEYAKKAFRLRERVTQREQFEIIGAYYSAVGDLDEDLRNNQVWEQTYPRDWLPWLNSSADLDFFGDYDRALKQAQEALRLNPDDLNCYVNVASSFLFLNRLDEAKQAAQMGLARGPEAPWVHLTLYEVAFFQNDARGMEAHIAALSAKPSEEVALAAQSSTEAYSGRLSKAREFSSRARESAQRSGLGEVAAGIQAAQALREAELGNTEVAKQAATSALAPLSGLSAKRIASLALARAGDVARSQALSDELNKSFPSDTLLHRRWLPTVRGAIALAQKNPPAALAALQLVAYELGQDENGWPPYVDLYPVYIRGQAYLAARQGREAAAEFQKIIDHRGIVLNETIGALAHVQLGRAYALQGDKAKARAAYQDFLALWKDADPDIPVFRQAKTEYAKLN